jgi:hypothetical protein
MARKEAPELSPEQKPFPRRLSPDSRFEGAPEGKAVNIFAPAIRIMH